jgi:hypothetical protein
MLGLVGRIAAVVAILGWCSAPIAAANVPRDELLAGLRAVAGPGSPGSVAALRETAVPLVLGGADAGTSAAVCVAGAWGDGRVVALGHSAYLDAATLADDDTGEFVARVIAWAAGRTAGERPGAEVRVGALDGGLDAWLSQRGFTPVRVAAISPEGLAGVDVLAMGVRDFTPAQAAALTAFVTGGRGLVAAQTGWGWKQIAGRSAPGGREPDMRTNPLNRLLLPAGIAWTDRIVSETDGDAFKLGGEMPGAMNVDAALEELLAPNASTNARRLAQASATALAGVRLLPREDTSVRPRLRSLIAERAGDLIPTADKPLDASRPLARLLLTVQLDEMLEEPPERVRAHPSAAHFPGPVPADAPRVERSIELAGVPRWQSTGLYVPAGEVVSITVPRAGAVARVGCHTDDLHHLGSWKRAPLIASWHSLEQGVTRLASPFGGLLYIEQASGDVATMIVSAAGAVEAPRYVLGETTPDAWRAIRSAPAPWGELQTPGVIISLPSSLLRTIDDPRELGELWQSILDHAADLRGISRRRAWQERFVPDLQISAGYMHAGYPIMTHMDAADDMASPALLRAGNWGLFHELGHNHQDPHWTFDGTVEVTCNLWSLYLMERIAGKPVSTGHPAIDRRDERERRAGVHIERGAPFDKWQSDPFLALEMYIQVREAFGWEPFTRAFRSYDALAEGERPRTQQDRRDRWMVRLSEEVGRNLGPFFTRWGVPVTAEAKARVQHLPAWTPEGW